MPKEKSNYNLPELPYTYNALVPYISEEQLRIHHDKHHAAYVKGANDIIDKLEKARKEGTEIDMKSTLKSLSFNLAGHVLHSLFWANLAPKAGGEPKGKLLEEIKSNFGSFEQFKKEFTAAAMNIEGSGWAALVNDNKSGRLVIMQIEKHNQNMYPEVNILLVLDMWEHAFYIDYKNEKGKFVEAFWNVVNWDEANKRL